MDVARKIEVGVTGPARAKRLPLSLSLLHGGKDATGSANGNTRTLDLRRCSSAKRSIAFDVLTEALNEVAAAHGLTDTDLAAAVDRAQPHVSAQMRGRESRPDEQLLLWPDEALRDVAGRLIDARAEFLRRWKDKR